MFILVELEFSTFSSNKFVISQFEQATFDLFILLIVVLKLLQNFGI